MSKNILSISNKLLLFVLSSFIFFSCQNDNNINTNIKVEDIKEEETFSIIYLKENKGIHHIENKETSFKFKKANLPIGVFKTKAINNQIINFEFPNDYYKNKQKHIGNFPKFDNRIITDQNIDKTDYIIIVPSKFNSQNHFEPCFNCPFWYQEQYVFLEYFLKSKLSQ